MSSQESQKPAAELHREPRLLAAALAGLLCLTPACGEADDGPKITSSTKVEPLDAAGFKALCDEAGGTVEELAHCGGLATAPGFAYDVGTQEISEHTCKGANTCAGWNCITD